MPYLISKEEVLEQVKGLEKLACWMCELLKDDELIIADDGDVVVRLTAFPRVWGHLMVCSKAHATNHTELPEKTWAGMSAAARKACLILEELFPERRIYTVALGTNRTDIPMSCAHMHFTIVPVNDHEEKPSSIFTFGNGVYAGEKEEWETLIAQLKACWARY